MSIGLFIIRRIVLSCVALRGLVLSCLALKEIIIESYSFDKIGLRCLV